MSIADTMLNHAFEGQKLTRKHFVVELDFSPQNVDDLDRIAGDVDFTLPGGASAENVELLARVWGSALGEIICREKGGTWVDSDKATQGGCVRIGGDEVDPHQLIRQRLEEGKAGMLREFYDGLA